MALSSSSLVVQKYGGSSVSSPEKIKQIAQRIIATAKQGVGVAVVVSAMGDTTDDLIALAQKVSSCPHERELDVLLSAGERISMALLSMALRDMGHAAISFTGSQAGILTDTSHTRARILEIKPVRVKEALARGKTVILAGFQGVSSEKEITTLGRGGSDTTAVAMALALNADRCEVLRDVAGIYSADPKLVPGAVRFEKLPIDLVFEMAVRGTQAMHVRALEIARERKFPLYVGHSQKEEGTMILPSMDALELPKVVAVTSMQGLVRMVFDASKKAAVLAELSHKLVLLHQLDIEADGSLSIVVQPDESAVFIEKYKTNVVRKDISSVSLIGYQMQQNAWIFEQLAAYLEKQGVQALGLTAQPQSITVWLPGQNPNALVQKLHQIFVERKNPT